MPREQVALFFYQYADISHLTFVTFLLRMWRKIAISWSSTKIASVSERNFWKSVHKF